MAESAEGSGPLPGWAEGYRADVDAYKASIDAAVERDDLIHPIGRLTESRFSKAKDKIFNVPVTDILKKMGKESALSVPVGIGAGLVVGTMGLGAAAGAATSVLAGASRGGIKEHYRQTSERWAQMRTEKNVDRLNFFDTLKGLTPTEKGRLVRAVGSGALKGVVFGSAGGAIGGAVGGALAETAVGHAAGTVAEGVREFAGEKAGGAVGKLGEAGYAIKGWKESWELPFGSSPLPPSEPAVGITEPTSAPTTSPRPTPVSTPELSPAPSAAPAGVIGAGPNSDEIKLPDDTMQWMKDANDINKDYGLMKQAEVGKMLPDIDGFLASQGITEANTDPVKLETLRDQLIGVAEDRVNLLDKHLQEAVENNMSLDEFQQKWGKEFTNWIGSDQMNASMTESLNSLQDGMAQIDQVVANPDSGGFAYFDPISGAAFNQFFTGFPDIEIGRHADLIGAHIAANYDVLNESWRKIHPDWDFPVHIGEIGYVVNLAIDGDPSAIERLKQAFSGLTKDQQLKILSDVGVKNIWEILTKLK